MVAPLIVVLALAASPKVDCAMVRILVQAFGVAEAEQMARRRGMSEDDIKSLEAKCLRK